MTVCPVALMVGCEKCPAFSVCPLKTVLGDQKKSAGPGAEQAAKQASSEKK